MKPIDVNNLDVTVALGTWPGDTNDPGATWGLEECPDAPRARES